MASLPDATSYVIKRSTTSSGSYSTIGTGSLVKTGVRILSLSGTNAYSGSTTINGGTLRITGVVANSANFSIDGSALDLSGTLNVGSLQIASSAEYLNELSNSCIPLKGAPDHGVSEALYLQDPDEIGVELYPDRRVGYGRAP